MDLKKIEAIIQGVKDRYARDAPVPESDDEKRIALLTSWQDPSEFTITDDRGIEVKLEDL